MSVTQGVERIPDSLGYLVITEDGGVLSGVEHIPDSLGYLVITEDGGVLSSGGELENDEKLADKLMSLVRNAVRVPIAGDSLGNFKRLSVTWDNFMYVITISNNKVFVCKRRFAPQEPAVV